MSNFDMAVDEGNGRLNPSRDENRGTTAGGIAILVGVSTFSFSFPGSIIRLSMS